MKHDKTTERIAALIKRERSEKLFSELFRFFAVTLLCAFVLSSSEALFRFDGEIRAAELLLLFICVIYTAYKFVLPAVTCYLRKVKFEEIVERARLLGENFPEIKDELANALELAESSREGFSDELVCAAYDRAFSLLPEGFFTDREKARKTSKFKYAFVALSVTLVFAFSTELQTASYRILAFTKEFHPPQKFFFVVSPGDSTLAKGDSLTLKAKITGEKPDAFSLFVKEEGEADYSLLRKFKTTRDIYYYKFEKVELPFDYFFYSEKVTSDTFSVSLVDLPFVREIGATVFPPSYTREKPVGISGEGNVKGLPGSRVLVRAEVNKMVRKAYLEFSYGAKIPFEISNEKITASFRIKRSGEYEIKLIDSLGYENRYPITYSVEMLTDEYPEIKILMPGKDVDLGNEDVVPLVIKISDDYGFRKLKLKYRLARSEFKKTSEKFEEIVLPLEKTSEQTVFYDWNLRPMNIEVNDVYEYYAEVYDNDFVGGPKKAVSKKYRIHLPPLEELLAKTEKENLKTLEEFKKSLHEAEELKKEMEKLSNELKKNKAEISWEEKKKLESASKKFERLAKRASELKKDLEKRQSELEKRNLLSSETIKKYEELQKLLSKLNDETLKKALQRMNKSLEQMQMDDVRKQMEELKKNEDAFRKSLERTIELFKRLLAEQKTDELLKRMKALEEEQKKIAEEFAKSSSAKETDKLTKKQADLGAKLEELRKEAENLSETMKDLEDMPSEEMSKLAEEMKNQNNSELAQKAAENMMMRNTSQAGQLQKELMRNLAKMSARMQNIQNSMRMRNQMKTMAEMMRLTREIVSLSKQEEALKKEVEKSSLTNSEIRRLAAAQNEIRQNIDLLLTRMQKLSKKTFAITPEMGNALGKARMKMHGAIGDLENRSRYGAENNTQGAMAALNEAADMMQSMLNRMANQQGGGQGGMMSLMQQLQQISGMQMQINSQTKQMLVQGRSQRELAQMQRLAAQQAALQKSLDELNREAKSTGKSKQLAANLDRIEEEMKEIINDLQSGNLNDELVKKQERILSRLLDAQRSINERDYEKRRESKAGRDFAGKSPEELRFEKEELNRLEREMREAEKEGYKADYRDLIKKYYKRLKEKEIENEKR